MSLRPGGEPAATGTARAPAAEALPAASLIPKRLGALRASLPAPGAQRTLAGSVLAVTVGGGLLMGSSTLYLTRIVGMSPTRVGFGLSAGAVLGLIAGPLVGHAADRHGPRRIQVATMVCGAVATAGFVIVRSFWTLMLVSLLTALVGAAAVASRAPLIRTVAGDRYTWFLSYLRAITNVGVMLGILIATIGIQLDTGPVYIAMILGSAATFLVAAAVLTRLPRVAPLPAEPNRSKWVALTDRPYLVVTFLNGVMSLHLAIPVFALPLWIVEHTSAPRPTITAVMVVNGLLIVGLQVRASRGVVDPASAGQRMRIAGVALLLAVILIAFTSGLSRWPAMLVLLLAIVVYTVGELWHSAASFELAFGLARPHAQGQYAGVFGLGQGAANATAPALLAPLCLGLGAPGWLAIGALLVGVGLVMPAVVGWAQRSRDEFSPLPQ